MLRLEAGYKYTGFKREFRETDKTSENVFRAAADWKGGWVTLRGLAELGSRDYDGYEAARSEDASFTSPGAPANPTVLRRYDQAKRDVRRFGAVAELQPADKLGVFASYTHTKFAYDQGHVECEDVSLFPGQDVFCPGGE